MLVFLLNCICLMVSPFCTHALLENSLKVFHLLDVGLFPLMMSIRILYENIHFVGWIHSMHVLIFTLSFIALLKIKRMCLLHSKDNLLLLTNKKKTTFTIISNLLYLFYLKKRKKVLLLFEGYSNNNNCFFKGSLDTGLSLVCSCFWWLKSLACIGLPAYSVLLQSDSIVWYIGPK